MVAGVLAFEGFFYYLPFHPSNQSVAAWIVLAGPCVYLCLKFLAKFDGKDPELAAFSKFILEKSDFVKNIVINKSVWFIKLLFIVVVLVTILWIPQYLVQPLWTDHEHVIIMARLWDTGFFPWTAMRTYQFPGEMQLAWLAAKIGGWGNPVAFYAMDLALLFATAITLACWSSRVFGSWKYAISSFVGLLAIELSLPFTGTAQRDTHSILVIIFAFCIPSLIKDLRFAAIFNGLLFGFALALRPHTILFIPILASGFLVANTSRKTRDQEILNGKDYLRLIIIWFVSTFISLLFFFSPVLGPIRTREFINALQFPLNQEGEYAQPIFAHWFKTYRDAYRVPRHFWYLAISTVMILKPGNESWRFHGLLLYLIFLTGAFYRAIHPVDHGYLQVPLQFLECIGLVVIPAWLVSQSSQINGLVWFALCGLSGHIATTSTDLYFEFSYFQPAVIRLITQAEPNYSPPGARAAYPLEPGIYHYDWSDWVESKAWITMETSTDTRVLNLLTYQPFPSFCATNNRLPTGRLESIVLLNWFKNYDFQPEIIESLEKAPAGTLVVWDQQYINEHNKSQLDKVSEFIFKTFQKRVRFGEIEFWEKLDLDK